MQAWLFIRSESYAQFASSFLLYKSIISFQLQIYNQAYQTFR